jgi:CBS domain-containing membrane protein
VVGVTLGMLLAGGLVWLSTGLGPSRWLVASLGASAVLVFVVPGSPLAQPWPVVVGSCVAATAGIAAVHLGDAVALAPPVVAALAVGLAAAGMLATRSLHAPGGGTAIVPVLLGERDFAFVLCPVGCNTVLLVLAGVLFHRSLRCAYPSRH